MARVLSFLIRYFSNYYTLHRSDLAARAAPLDPRLRFNPRSNLHIRLGILRSSDRLYASKLHVCFKMKTVPTVKQCQKKVRKKDLKIFVT